MKDIKILLKKKTKTEKRLIKDVKILLKNEKEKSVNIVKNVIKIFHKKQLLCHSVRILRIQILKKYIQYPYCILLCSIKRFSNAFFNCPRLLHFPLLQWLINCSRNPNKNLIDDLFDALFVSLELYCSKMLYF